MMIAELNFTLDNVEIKNPFFLLPGLKYNSTFLISSYFYDLLLVTTSFISISCYSGITKLILFLP